MSVVGEREQLAGLVELVQKARLTLEEAERTQVEPLAIIGIGCRFPGGADDPERFWDLLSRGESGIVEVPPERWKLEDYYDPEQRRPGTLNNRCGGFLTGLGFEPEFFGITPREAAGMDPQQCLFLEVCWEALENAALVPRQLAGSRTGVFVGVCSSDYAALRTRELASLDAYASTGSAHSIIANRVSYLLDLAGPSLAVDTACSSSLLAVHLACQSLRSKESDLVLAGGVNLILSPAWGISFSSFGMLSPVGRCKTFDAAADGFVRSEGAGVVVLKRLSDARRDGDRIWAVIRGSAVNQDGRSNGLTAPSIDAQRRVVAGALRNARVKAEEIGYLEAHGTGTPLGDPIELEALSEVFPVGRRCFVGAAKANIGHTEGAAGIAGLIKSALVLQHGLVPPQVNFQTLNPHIVLDNTPFEIPRRLEPWSEPAGTPRRAGVSSFGFGGTNVHVVLEQAPLSDARALQASDGSASSERPSHLLALSASTERALRVSAARYAAVLRKSDSLADVCHSANTRRSSFAVRLCAHASTAADMATALEKFGAGGDGDPACVSGLLDAARRPRLAFMFTGQGAQYHGMGRALFESQPRFRSALERCDAIALDLTGTSILAAIYGERSDDQRLASTDLAQLSLFCIEHALAELWQSFGVVPQAVIGHSVGEIVAATTAGVLSLEDALLLVAERGRLMRDAPGEGAMAVAYAPESTLVPCLARHGDLVEIAAVNGRSETVLSGERRVLQAVCADLLEQGVQTRPLSVSHAFHSALMSPILDPFTAAITRLSFQPARMPLISNVTGTWAEAGELQRADYWRRHVRAKVRFAEGLGRLIADGFTHFLEIGPHATLASVGARDWPTATWLPSLRRGHAEWPVLLAALQRLCVDGNDIDWAGFDRDFQRRVVPVPTYPWQRTPYVAPSISTEQSPSAGFAGHPLLGAPVAGPGSIRQFESRLGRNDPAWLDDHRVAGAAIVPAGAWMELALGAGQALLGPGVTVEALKIDESLALPASGATTLRTLLSPQAYGFDLETFSLVDTQRGAEPGAWRRHVSARLVGATEAGLEAAVDLAQLRQHCRQIVDVSAFYERLAARSIAHGAAFHCLSSAQVSDEEAYIELVLPAVCQADVDRYSQHPVLLDGAFQALACVLLQRGVEGVYLPTSIQRFASPRAGAARSSRLYCHAILRSVQVDTGTITADVRLCDADGSVVALLEQIVLRRAALASAEHAGASGEQLEGQETIWLPLAPRSEQPVAAEFRIIALAGESGRAWASQIVESLRPHGDATLAVIGEPGCSFESSGDDFMLDVTRPDQLEALLRTSEPGDRRPALLVLLGPTLAGLGDAGLGEQRRLCGTALACLQALGARRGADCLCAVTQGACSVTGDEISDVRMLAQSSLWGLSLVIEKEHPELWAGIFDIEPRATAEAVADWLRARTRLAPDSARLAIRAGQELSPRLVPRVLPTGAAGWAPLHQDRTYLVTGGLGGLGLEVASWLAQRGARHLVLVGRRSSSADADGSLLEPLQRAGASVRYVACDVADAKAVGALIALIQASGAPLAGVVHAAGVLDDGLLTELTWERFVTVMAPKILGAWNLHQVTLDLPLDTFLLFSSAAGVVGSVGQASYAAANAWLDGLARYRRCLKRPALSVQWGPWQAGMGARVKPEVLARWRREGVEPLAIDRALAHLAAALEDDSGVLGVWHAVVPARQAAGAPAKLRQELAQLAGAARPGRLLAHLQLVVGAAMGKDGSAPIGPESSLFDLGVDSLMAVEIRNRLQVDLELAIPGTVLFEHPTPASLGKFLLKELHPEPETAAASAAGETGDVAAASDDLDGLDERGMAAVLWSELRASDPNR